MTKPRRRSAIAKVMKAIGYVTDPKTTPGKAFAWWEKGVTSAMGKLAQNDVYLNVVGKMMEQTFRTHAHSVRAMEDMLHHLRMPTVTDVVDLREQVHHLNDQVEAMSAQLELLIEALDASRRRKPSASGDD
jgi:hypothetical protein